MPLIAKSVTDIPKREAPGRTVDLDEAKSIYAILSAKGPDGQPQTATDDIAYDDIKKARATSNKYRRLVSRVVPDGEVVKTRVYEIDGKTRWAIYLSADKKAAAKAAKADEKPAGEKPADEKPADEKADKTK